MKHFEARKEIKRMVDRINCNEHSHRVFKCLCCGHEWLESINSPVVIEDKDVENNLSSYYPKTIRCEKLK